MPIDFQTRLLLRELQHQCDESLAAIHVLNRHLQSQSSSARDIINSIDDFVDHAARAALILWPVRKFRIDSAATVRKTISIGDDHPLKDKGLRHSLQHFDERLQEWVDKNPKGSIADFLVGPENMVVGGTQFRRFDPVTKMYYFLGESFDIQAHVQGVEEVLAKVKAVLQDNPKHL